MEACFTPLQDYGPAPLGAAFAWGVRAMASSAPNTSAPSSPASRSAQIAPAIPTLVEPFHYPGWVYEEKVDGWRVSAYERGDAVQLVSRTGRDHTARFSDVARAIAKLSPAR